jgi:hypothetical protein
MIPKVKPTVDILVAVRLDHNNIGAYDYLLLPREEVRGVSIRIIEGKEHPFEIYRSADLKPLYAVLAPGYSEGLSLGERILRAIQVAQA